MVANQLKQLETILRLPVQDTSTSSAYPTSNIPLKVGFSVLRIRADDPAEKLFLEILRQISRNPVTADANVIAYPIFGRGRCFGALAGSDLSQEGIEQACSFLVGPCSCVIKSQNPGVDLLMSVKWDDLVSGKVAVDEELPPLRGLMPAAATVAATPAAQPIPSTNGRRPVVLAPAVLEKGNLTRNVLAALGGGVVLVLGCAIFIWRKRR